MLYTVTDRCQDSPVMPHPAPFFPLSLTHMHISIHKHTHSHCLYWASVCGCVWTPIVANATIDVTLNSLAQFTPCFISHTTLPPSSFSILLFDKCQMTSHPGIFFHRFHVGKSFTIAKLTAIQQHLLSFPFFFSPLLSGRLPSGGTLARRSGCWSRWRTESPVSWPTREMVTPPATPPPLVLLLEGALPPEPGIPPEETHLQNLTAPLFYTLTAASLPSWSGLSWAAQAPTAAPLPIRSLPRPATPMSPLYMRSRRQSTSPHPSTRSLPLTCTSLTPPPSLAPASHPLARLRPPSITPPNRASRPMASWFWPGRNVQKRPRVWSTVL